MTRRRFQITKEGIFPDPSSTSIRSSFIISASLPRKVLNAGPDWVRIGCVSRGLFSSASAKPHRYPGSKPFRAVRLVTMDDGEPLPPYHNGTMNYGSLRDA